MVSKLAVGIIVAIVVVGGGAATYVLMRSSEAPETYDLFYDYKVGEYYVSEATSTTTMDDTVTEDFSTYTLQVTAVEDNEITVKHISTVENAEVTIILTMTKKGETISWEIESVVPLELWENVELYENSQMVYSQLFENFLVFPYEPIPIRENWETSVSSEMEWGPDTYLPLTGEGSTHFVGQENVTVEAGTFDCWRLDYGASISGELTNGYTATMDMTFEGTTWYSKLNCAQIKSTMSMTMSMESGDYQYEYLSESVVELVEQG